MAQRPSIPDCYVVLGVHRNATSADIRSTYRKLTKKWHPDKIGGDGKIMAEIVQSYQILANKTSRSKYDSNHAALQSEWQRYYAGQAGQANHSRSQNASTTAGPADVQDEPNGDTESTEDYDDEDPETFLSDDSGSEYVPDASDDDDDKHDHGYGDLDEEGGSYAVDMGDGRIISLEEHELECGCLSKCTHKRLET